MASKPEVARFLRKAKSHDPDVRFDAVSRLPEKPDATIDAALTALVDDPDSEVAVMALHQLGTRRYPRMPDVILRMLKKRPSKRFRQYALWEARFVDISPHLEEAWSALEGPIWVDRTAGAGALAKAGVKKAIPKIRELAYQAVARRQYYAAPHLFACAALLGDKESQERYLAQLTSRSDKSRSAAAAWLERGTWLQGMAEAVGEARLRATLLAATQIYESARPSTKVSIYRINGKRRFGGLLKALA